MTICKATLTNHGITFLLSFVWILVSVSTYAQVIPSSCTLPDSVELAYERDIERLTFDYIFDINDSAIHDIQLPENYKLKFRDAIGAIYNSGLSSADSVFQTYDIHSYDSYVLRQVYVRVYDTTQWVLALQDSILPTGYSGIDTLLDACPFQNVYIGNTSTNTKHV